MLLVSTSSIADSRPLLSLVIDDLGYSLKQGKAAIELPGDHTYAVLPEASYSQKLAKLATDQGKEIILHMPMQSLQSKAAAEPGALHEGMDENQLLTNVRSMLNRFPDIAGINNHMGSHLTEHDFFMRPVMDSIRFFNPQLYFLDSRTTARSVAFTQARAAGLKSTSRDVFLDYNPESIESIELQVQIWLAKAREMGSAIAIGHPHQNTLTVMQRILPQFSDEYDFVPLSRIVAERDVSDEPAVPSTRLVLKQQP